MEIRAAVTMVLTFVFGIVPATLLVVWAVMLGVVGLGALLLVGQPGAALLGLSFIAVSVLAVFGYVALFYAAGDLITRRIAIWLLGGVVAEGVALVLLAEQARWFDASDWLVLGAPLLAGCTHLVRYGANVNRARSRS